MCASIFFAPDPKNPVSLTYPEQVLGRLCLFLKLFTLKIRLAKLGRLGEPYQNQAYTPEFLPCHRCLMKPLIQTYKLSKRTHDPGIQVAIPLL